MESKIDQIEIAIDKMKAYKKALFDVDFIACALVDKNGYVRDASARLCRELGVAKHNLIRRHFADFTHPDDIEKDIKLYSGPSPL